MILRLGVVPTRRLFQPMHGSVRVTRDTKAAPIQGCESELRFIQTLFRCRADPLRSRCVVVVRHVATREQQTKVVLRFRVTALGSLAIPIKCGGGIPGDQFPFGEGAAKIELRARVTLFGGKFE